MAKKKKEELTDKELAEKYNAPIDSTFDRTIRGMVKNPNPAAPNKNKGHIKKKKPKK